MERGFVLSESSPYASGLPWLNYKLPGGGETWSKVVECNLKMGVTPEFRWIPYCRDKATVTKLVEALKPSAEIVSVG